jgi:hypothetical protein
MPDCRFVISESLVIGDCRFVIELNRQFTNRPITSNSLISNHESPLPRFGLVAQLSLRKDF